MIIIKHLVLTIVSMAVVFVVAPQSVRADQASLQAAKQDAEFATRLQNRKDKMIKKLVIEQKLSLASKCVTAQTKIKPATVTTNDAATKRIDKYTNLVKKLESTSKTLSERSVDVTKLDESIKNLKQLIETFQKDFDVNNLAMSDLVDMSCASDPESFKATLEEARSSLIAVRADSLKIHTHLSETIKPLLKDLKSQLETSSKKPEETQR
jgi:lipopolysaccharide export LptBFGC system permease protein LptF